MVKHRVAVWVKMVSGFHGDLGSESGMMGYGYVTQTAPGCGPPAQQRSE